MVGEGKSASHPFIASELQIHPLLCPFVRLELKPKIVLHFQLVPFSASSTVGINRGAVPGEETSVEWVYLLFLFYSVAAWKLWTHVTSRELLGPH